MLRVRYYFVSAVLNGAAGGMRVVKKSALNLWRSERIVGGRKLFLLCWKKLPEGILHKEKKNKLKNPGEREGFFEGIRHGAREKERRLGGIVCGRCFVYGQEHGGSVRIGAIFR